MRMENWEKTTRENHRINSWFNCCCLLLRSSKNFALFTNNFSAFSRAFHRFPILFTFSPEKIIASFRRSRTSLSLCYCKEFSHFQVKRCKQRREEKNLCTGKILLLFSPQMQTFSIFLSSGTDEKENVKKFYFFISQFSLNILL